MKPKPIDFVSYQRLRNFTYNQMCHYLDIITEKIVDDTRRQVCDEALELAKKQIIGDADETYILDEDEARRRLMSVKGISRRLADECLRALEV